MSNDIAVLLNRVASVFTTYKDKLIDPVVGVFTTYTTNFGWSVYVSIISIMMYILALYIEGISITQSKLNYNNKTGNQLNVYSGIYKTLSNEHNIISTIINIIGTILLLLIVVYHNIAGDINNNTYIKNAINGLNVTIFSLTFYILWKSFSFLQMPRSII
jgi:hypothetical protein